MQYHVAVVDARYRCYATDHGTDRHYTGPSFELPRPAIDYAKALEDRATATTAARAAESDPGVDPDAIPAPVAEPGAAQRPTTPGGDEPDLTGGFWGAAESRGGERRHRGSPDSANPLRDRG